MGYFFHFLPSFLLAIVSFTIIMVIFCVPHRKLARKKSKETDNTKGMMRQDASYLSELCSISIESSGFQNDRWLSKTQVIKMLVYRWMTKPKNTKYRMHLLCFSDIIIPTILSVECDRIIELLQTLHKLPISIDWVLAEDVPWKDFSSYVNKLEITCDNIYEERSLLCMKKYDMILHPYSGLDSSYEIIVGLLQKLKEEVQS